MGKTIQAIAALRILVQRGEIPAALVVAPIGLLLQWRQQFRAFAPFRPILLTGGMSAAARDAALVRFAHDPEHGVMILSLRAGGI